MPGLLSQENRRALARGLLDTTQAASNSAASTVSAPVDALAWLLRKAGAPIPQAPFGGSDWMKSQGLMRDVQSPVANAVGETLGGVLPIVAAAKGPQIAAGLLKMGENAAARTPMNAATGNQAGAIVWHGSPYKFDRFDSSKIGTGEGAQAYGHGHYSAEAKNVGEKYRRNVSQQTVLVDGQPARDLATSFVGQQIQSFGDAAKARDYFLRKTAELERIGASYKPALVDAERFRQYATKAEELTGKKINTNDGYLYKVDLPDDAIARMLDWDKPINAQAPEVLDMLRRAGVNEMSSALAGPMARGQEAHLQKFGIPGIRYLDGGSRGAGSGTSNFVVFPGNEGLLNILERNGKPIR